MSDQGNMGGAAASDAGNVNAAHGAAPPPPAGAERAIDRTRGHSPARDYREQRQQQGAPGEGQGHQQHDDAAAPPQMIKIGDVEYSADQVNDALRFKSEQEIRKGGLPATADAYEVKLPADFKAPEGVNFQFDPNSAELKNFQRLAHARGLDQQTFSEALGIFAATKIGEQQMLATGRNAEMSKLGSAAHNRIAAVETWLKSQVGAKANGLVAQLRNFPVAAYVEVFETLARNAVNQGGSRPLIEGGRSEPENPGRIEGYDKMTFSQRRAAQDALNARRQGRG